MAQKRQRKQVSARRAKPRRTAGRSARETQDVERPATAPEVTMSETEMDRLRDRLRRKYH
jgi:hypothetical protein